MIINPLSAKKSSTVYSDLTYVSARLTVPYRNFTHLWFRFLTCRNVFSWRTCTSFGT